MELACAPCSTGAATRPLDRPRRSSGAEAYPTVEVLAEHWRRDEEEMRSWLGRLTDADLMTPWELESPGGRPLWQHLIHVYAHGIQQLCRRRRRS